MSGNKPLKPEWFVYIVECADRSLYTGVALDVAERMAEHSRGKGSRYVRSKLPIKLLYRENCSTKSKALKREAAIKKLPRPAKLAFLKNSGKRSQKAKVKRSEA